MSHLVFGWCLCCLGGRRRGRNSVIPDEESRLLIPAIPPEVASTMGPSIPTLVIVDRQKLKDKLAVIVRSTEGKMVNVNSHVPFNLHGQSLNGPPAPTTTTTANALGTTTTTTTAAAATTTTSALNPTHQPYFQSSSSRSASTSTNPRNSGILTYNQNHNQTMTTTPLSSRQGSLSRSSSVSLSLSVSEDNGSNAGGGGGGRNRRYNKPPILNVRLVRDVVGVSGGSTGGESGRRGRTRVRAGSGNPHLVDDDPHHEVQGEGEMDMGQGKGKGKTHEHEDTMKNHGLGIDVDMAGEGVIITPSSSHGSSQQTPHAKYFQSYPSIDGTLVPTTTTTTTTTPYSKPFKIENPGDIAIGWGD